MIVQPWWAYHVGVLFAIIFITNHFFLHSLIPVKSHSAPWYILYTSYLGIGFFNISCKLKVVLSWTDTNAQCRSFLSGTLGMLHIIIVQSMQKTVNYFEIEHVVTKSVQIVNLLIKEIILCNRLWCHVIILKQIVISISTDVGGVAPYIDASLETCTLYIHGMFTVLERPF